VREKTHLIHLQQVSKSGDEWIGTVEVNCEDQKIEACGKMIPVTDNEISTFQACMCAHMTKKDFMEGTDFEFYGWHPKTSRRKAKPCFGEITDMVLAV
jgi:hypothetical protein